MNDRFDRDDLPLDRFPDDEDSADQELAGSSIRIDSGAADDELLGIPPSSVGVSGPGNPDNVDGGPHILDASASESIDPIAENPLPDTGGELGQANEPSPTPTAASSADSSERVFLRKCKTRDEFGRYMDEFGAANGAKWYRAGLSFAEAQARYIANLKLTNERLEKENKLALESEPYPLSSGGADENDRAASRRGFVNRIRFKKDD